MLQFIVSFFPIIPFDVLQFECTFKADSWSQETFLRNNAINVIANIYTKQRVKKLLRDIRMHIWLLWRITLSLIRIMNHFSLVCCSTKSIKALMAVASASSSAKQLKILMKKTILANTVDLWVFRKSFQKKFL